MIKVLMYIQVKMSVRRHLGGIIHIKLKYEVLELYGIVVINIVHDVARNIPFNALVRKLSSVDHKFSKGMVIEYATFYPNVLVSLQGTGTQGMCCTLNVFPTAQKAVFKYQ